MAALRFRYQTVEFGDVDIHVKTLRNRQEYQDADGNAAALGISSANWSLFGVVWNSGEVLAQHMQTYEIHGKRILEVGCGLALTSLLLNLRLADITATDYHPEVGALLAENVELNGGRIIPFIRTAWADGDDTLGLFDVIVGSDVLYEHDHALLLSNFIDRHAKHQCQIILVDPGRGYQGRFSKHMVALGYSHVQHKPKNLLHLSQPFSGHILRFAR